MPSISLTRKMSIKYKTKLIRILKKDKNLKKKSQ